MNIDVNECHREPIDGVADMASIDIREDFATVAVATAQRTRSPRPGQHLEFADARWRVDRTVKRTKSVLTFTCKRVSNG